MLRKAHKQGLYEIFEQSGDEENACLLVDHICDVTIRQLDVLLSEIKYTKDKDLIVSKINKLKERYK